jgi:hypothetical protein
MRVGGGGQRILTPLVSNVFVRIKIGLLYDVVYHVVTKEQFKVVNSFEVSGVDMYTIIACKLVDSRLLHRSGSPI